MSVKEKTKVKQGKSEVKEGRKCEPSYPINAWECVTNFILSFLVIKKPGVDKQPPISSQNLVTNVQ